jgi:Tol biopolymer transport system component
MMVRSVYKIPVACVIAAIAAALLFISVASAQAAFPGQNGRIAFVSQRDGNYEIYSMNPDGSDVRRLTNDPGQDLNPAPSPDGRTIMFDSNRLGPTRIYVMNADGSGVRLLTSTSFRDSNPSFSPDGKTIVFESLRDGSNALYTMNAADGSGVRKIVAGDAYAPSFSPDGSKVLFTADRGIGPAAYTVNPDGTNGAILFAFGNGVLNPSYSPDGRSILFDSPGSSRKNIYVRDPAGAVTALTTSASGEYKGSASFSPDGSKVAFEAGPGGGQPHDIYTMNADGTGQLNRTNTIANDGAPTWMPASPYDDATRPQLTLGSPRAKKRKGTATVDAFVSRAGKLAISGSGVSAEQRSISGAGSTTIALRATGKARKKLAKKGKVSVSLSVTYTPEIGDPITRSVNVKLVRTRRKR